MNVGFEAAFLQKKKHKWLVCIWKDTGKYYSYYTCKQNCYKWQPQGCSESFNEEDREFEISCFICWWSEYKTGQSLEESGCHFLSATSVRLFCNWIIPFLNLNPKYQRLCLYKVFYKHSYNRIHHKMQDIFLSAE